MQTFAKFALKMARNTSKTIWRPGSTRTRWGAYSALPDPLAGLQGEGEGEGKRKGTGEK